MRFLLNGPQCARLARLQHLSSIALTVCLFAAACQPAPASPKGALRVLAVETFLADIAQNVAGDREQVGALIPLGVDPHAFEPTPQDVAKIADSQMLIINGAGFETWLQKVLANTGKQNLLIEATAGLKSRTAREGEVAVMTDAELADAMCSAAADPAQAATAGATSAGASALPVEAGLFTVTLNKQLDGSYGGFLNYSTDEGGQFQVASGGGAISVLQAGGSEAVAVDQTLSLACSNQNVRQGNVVRLEAGGQYVLALSGYSSPQATLLVGPAGGQHPHQDDPHFWLDPSNVIKYVENIRDGLSQADPAGAAVYAKNAEAYIVQLKELDAWIVAELQAIPPERRLMVTNHESFGYFADRYGFKIVGTIVPSVSTDASPSAQQLARLVDRVRATGATAIFLETGANPLLAQQVAQETGVKVVTGLYTHSITGPGGNAPSYIAMMKYDVQAITAALK